ncbi:caspase b-like isoform X2 [Hoplias malabaricus]|uniref:caspase b-like isoform X2 n=1 Tax=Hoplias malabaricus TaxID=27720 RepID=UPI0034624AF9
MATVSSVLLYHLDELLDDEFKRFKWYLTEGKLQGINPIAKSKLENVKQIKVVSLMEEQYGSSDAGKIAVRILREMQQNNLAKKLEENLREVQCGGGSGVAGSGYGVSCFHLRIKESCRISQLITAAVLKPLLLRITPSMAQ